MAVMVAAFGLAVAQQQRLEVWTFIDPDGDNVRASAMAHVIETFEAMNPDIDVVVNVLQWQQLDPSLLRAVNAQQAPDVTTLFSPSMQAHIAAGTLTPLDEYIAGWPQERQDDTVVLAQSQGQDGTVYGIPWELRVSGFMYRQDVLEEAGLEPPTSLQELEDVAATVSDDGLIGIALGFGPEAPSIASGWFIATLVGLGGPVLNEDGTASLVSEEAERLVQWVYNLSAHEQPILPLDVALLGLEQAQQLFIARQAAFLPSSTQRFEFIRDNADLGDNLKMMSYLTFEPGQPAPALVQSWSLVIPRGARNPDAAWQFIEHWTSTEIQVEQAKTAGYIPVRSSALADPWFETDDATIIRWAVDYAANHPLDFIFPENTNALYDTIARMFERVLAGQMSPREGLEWAEAEYNRMIQ